MTQQPNPPLGGDEEKELETALYGAVGHELRRQLSHSFRHMSIDGPTQTLGFSAPSRPDVTVALKPFIDAILSTIKGDA